MNNGCDRCKKDAKTYFIEVFNPCTGELRTIWLCRRCMCTAARRMTKYAEGGR